MEFPLLKNDADIYPDDLTCAWCKCDNVCEPNSMAILEAGALLMNRVTDDGASDDSMDGFLHIVWHGAHLRDKGLGEFPNIYEHIPIAEDVRGGQLDIRFCSTKCLRAFLNHAVDALEERITLTQPSSASFRRVI